MKEIKPLKPPILKNLLETNCDQSVTMTPEFRNFIIRDRLIMDIYYRDNIGEQKNMLDAFI